MNSTYKSNIFYANAGSHIYRNNEGLFIFNDTADGTYIFKLISKCDQPYKQENSADLLQTKVEGTIDRYYSKIANGLEKMLFAFIGILGCTYRAVKSTKSKIKNYVQKIVDYVKTTSRNVFNTYWKSVDGMDISKNSV